MALVSQQYQLIIIIKYFSLCCTFSSKPLQQQRYLHLIWQQLHLLPFPWRVWKLLCSGSTEIQANEPSNRGWTLKWRKTRSTDLSRVGKLTECISLNMSNAIEAPPVAPKNKLKASFRVQNKIENVYTGGKVLLSKSEKFLVCPCFHEVKLIDIHSGQSLTTLSVEEVLPNHRNPFFRI